MLLVDTSRLPATPTARAYIAGLFKEQVHRPIDWSRESVVLAYANNPDFSTLQALGDWALWFRSMWPAVCCDATVVIGQLSYYRCYRQVPSWLVYEELADNLPVLSQCAARAITSSGAATLATSGRSQQ